MNRPAGEYYPDDFWPGVQLSASIPLEVAEKMRADVRAAVDRMFMELYMSSVAMDKRQRRRRRREEGRWKTRILGQKFDPRRGHES